MHINLVSLKNGNVDEIVIDSEYSFSTDELAKVGIIDLQKGKVTGTITKDQINEYYLDLTIEGLMILPCSLTLKPVNYPFEAKISGNLTNIFEEIGQIPKNLENTIDILPIIWENILMEIPMKVVSDETSDLKLQGDGWKLVREDEPQINPELEKLKDLL